MKEKIKMWLRNNNSKIVGVSFVIVFIALSISQYTIYQLQEQNEVIFPKVEKEIIKLEPKVLEVDKQLEVIEKNADKKEAEQCSITEAGKLVLADASILKQSNYVFYDLDTFKYGTNRYDYTTSKKTKKNIFGVRYAREDRDGTQIYLMIYENVDNLKVNKKEYDKFMESQK